MAEFIYQEPFPIEADTTEYRLLTKDYVKVVECDGRQILKVDPKGLELLAKEAYSDVSFYLRASHLEKLSNILKDPEATDNDKFVAYTMLLNQCWEAAMFTAGKRLTNITWIIDNNKRQLDGWTKNVLEPFDFEEKFRAFGFDAVTVKGDDVMGLYAALTAPVGDKPRAIVLDSVKGAGVPDVENTFGNHSMSPSKDTCDKWLAELNAQLAAME